MSNTPSDAEIEKLAAEHLKAFAQFTGAGGVRVEGEVAFARAALAKRGAPQPAPAPLSDDVVRDAARYRWLRATTNYVTSNGERIDVRNMPETWDVAIDAAIAAQGGK